MPAAPASPGGGGAAQTWLCALYASIAEHERTPGRTRRTNHARNKMTQRNADHAPPCSARYDPSSRAGARGLARAPRSPGGRPGRIVHGARSPLPAFPTFISHPAHPRPSYPPTTQFHRPESTTPTLSSERTNNKVLPHCPQPTIPAPHPKRSSHARLTGHPPGEPRNAEMRRGGASGTRLVRARHAASSFLAFSIPSRRACGRGWGAREVG